MVRHNAGKMRKDELLFRKPKNRIEQLVRDQILKRRLTREIKKLDPVSKLTKTLKRSLPIPIIIGIAASAIMYRFYGGAKLIETLLSWIIGMTLIAFIITSILSKYEKK